MALRENAGSVLESDGGRMSFLKGSVCELRPLEATPEEVAAFTKAVNAGLTVKYLMTGSIPMRQIDFKEWVESERKAKSILLGIYTLGGIFVGITGLHSFREIYHSAEFRILIFDPSAIGYGLGTEATKLITQYGFERLNLNRVWLGVHAENIGAIKCYRKVGFKEEGRLREELYTYGKYSDAIRMGILRREWSSSSPVVAR